MTRRPLRTSAPWLRYRPQRHTAPVLKAPSVTLAGCPRKPRDAGASASPPERAREAEPGSRLPPAFIRTPADLSAPSDSPDPPDPPNTPTSHPHAHRYP
jgi:hypothetical protein